MVVPDGVVEAERLVTPAPLVTGTLVTVDDDRGDAELPQPRTERDTALPSADDQRVGLDRASELALLGLATFAQDRGSSDWPCTAPITRRVPCGSS